MRPKRYLVPAVCELTTVFLVAGAVFTWGKRVALAERGYEAIGGEYLLLLLPAVYYVGKWMLVSWISDIRNLWRGV